MGSKNVEITIRDNSSLKKYLIVKTMTKESPSSLLTAMKKPVDSEMSREGERTI